MRPPRSHTQYKFHYPSQWRPKEISKPSLSPSLLSSRYNLNNTCLTQESFSRITTRKFRLCRFSPNHTIIPHTSRFQLARLSFNTVTLVWTGKTHSSLSLTELYFPTHHLRRAVLPPSPYTPMCLWLGMLGGITQWQAVIGLRRGLTDNWSGFYVAGWLLIPTTLPPRQIVLMMGHWEAGQARDGRDMNRRGRAG